MWTNILPPGLLNTVHCMDCLEFMRALPDKCVDLCLVDPPYGIWDKLLLWWKKWKVVNFWKQYLETEWEDTKPSQEYFDEIFRVSKNQVIFWWNYFSLPPTRGIVCRDKNIWTPDNFSHWELARTSFDKPAKKFVSVNDGDKLHPTQKPIKLFRRILENYSEQWMTILDCFAWSWTTWVACKELWRNYILVEKEPKYVDIIHKRLQNTTVSLFHS